MPRTFPYGTLAVNVLGSFLMGLSIIMIDDHFKIINQALRLLLLVGFLGGFTTFSAFSIETVNLLESNKIIQAGIYVLSSVILCLLAAWLGSLLAKQL